MQTINNKIGNVFNFSLEEFIKKGLIWNVFGFIISVSISLIIFFTLGFSRKSMLLVIFAFVLYLEAVYDVLYKKVQVALLLFASAIKVVELLVFWDRAVFTQMMWGILALAIVLLLAKISKGGIGDGDAMMIAVITFYIGIKHSVLLVLIALLLLIVLSVPLLLSKKLSAKSALPFVPFLYAAFFLLIVGASI